MTPCLKFYYSKMKAPIQGDFSRAQYDEFVSYEPSKYIKSTYEMWATRQQEMFQKELDLYNSGAVNISKVAVDSDDVIKVIENSDSFIRWLDDKRTQKEMKKCA